MHAYTDRVYIGTEYICGIVGIEIRLYAKPKNLINIQPANKCISHISR